jgi:hypothetical protein
LFAEDKVDVVEFVVVVSGTTEPNSFAEAVNVPVVLLSTNTNLLGTDPINFGDEFIPLDLGEVESLGINIRGCLVILAVGPITVGICPYRDNIFGFLVEDCLVLGHHQ